MHDKSTVACERSGFGGGFVRNKYESSDGIIRTIGSWAVGALASGPFILGDYGFRGSETVWQLNAY
jgi:hypothetical protein